MEKNQDCHKNRRERGLWGAHDLVSGHQIKDILLGDLVCLLGVSSLSPLQSLTHRWETGHLLDWLGYNEHSWLEPNMPGMSCGNKQTEPIFIVRRGECSFHILRDSKGSCHRTRMGRVTPGVCQWRNTRGCWSLCILNIFRAARTIVYCMFRGGWFVFCFVSWTFKVCCIFNDSLALGTVKKKTVLSAEESSWLQRWQLCGEIIFLSFLPVVYNSY